MYICNNDVFFFIKILEKERQQYGTIDMRHFRLLAIKNGIPKELEYASFSNVFAYDKYKKLKKKKEDSSTYKRLKREGLNDMEIYKKSFQCKYNKKKGLAKLDGYCEKKIFDKLDNICGLAKMMNDEKKRYKKVLLLYIFIKIIKYDRLVDGKVKGKKLARKISRYYND
ncbi:variable surface protein Vir10 [Plasmodium vivax Brazil I]|uniref:Variable surface protein Vir10 n=1 Tax=Plasmodium vivax (strain Brazil I) TaxID=1033975 RepID=A0A0J9T2I0_PLAV1|nr:variable surface protein Vir10 [Plasmodium vivax Brazil I]